MPYFAQNNNFVPPDREIFKFRHGVYTEVEMIVCFSPGSQAIIHEPLTSILLEASS